MDRLTTIALQVGDWRIDPQLGQMTRGTEAVRLEARALRRLLGDDAKQPNYIVTVPRLGYRLIAPVRPAVETPELAVPPPPVARPRRAFWIGAVALLVGLSALLWHANTMPDARSVAVLPFLDLTSQAMDEEYFADGLTEELIDRLSREAGFKVPAASASFYYKDKSLPPAQIARELHVNYLLEGSLRESGEILRITARLTRASDSYVLWTQTYERPKPDRLKIQDEIAQEVTEALLETVR